MRPKPSPASFSFLGMFVPLVLGGMLLWLATPRAVAAFYMLPGDVVKEKLGGDKPPSDDDLMLLVSSREKAARFANTGIVKSDMALGLFELAQRRGLDTNEGKALLDRAASVLRRGLAEAPANTYGWARLAFIENRLEFGSPAAIEALRMSVMTAQFEPYLLLSRMFLALKLRPYWDDDMTALQERQVRLSWQWNPRQLAKAAKQYGAQDYVAGIIGDDPAAKESWNKLMKEEL